MKCEEMMNLMQQSLDQDLTAEEERVMLAHLKQCPGCSDLYVRLKLLNEELAQLPKVKPAYSIVDAILPQLEELPLWGAEPASGPETSAAAKEQAVPFSTAAARKNRRGLVSWKIFSGVAAAGIIIGLMLSNPDNLRLDQSASESAVMKNEAGAPQAASGKEKFSGDVNKEAPPAMDRANADVAVVPTQTVTTGASSGAPSATPAASAGESGEQKDMSGRVTVASPPESLLRQQEQQQLSQSSNPPSSEQKEPAAGASPAASGDNQQQAADSPEASASEPEGVRGESPGSETSLTDIYQSFMATDVVEKSGVAGPAQEKAATALPVDADAKRTALQALTGTPVNGAPEPQTSPDGLYTAAVVEGKVTIAGKGGASVFVSPVQQGPEDQVTFQGWTDAHTFSYTLRSANGTETVYVISASEGKEWKK